MIQFKAGKSTGDLLIFQRVCQMGIVIFKGTDVRIENFLVGKDVGMGNSHLCHNRDGLSVGTDLLRLHLRLITHVFTDFLRNLEQIECGLDAEFPPVLLVKE